MFTMYFLVFILIVFSYSSRAIEPGPVVKATKGAVWPKPQQQTSTQDFYVIKPHTFAFKPPDNIGCPNFLSDAFTRYWAILAASILLETSDLEDDEHFLGYLPELSVNVQEECVEGVFPALGDAENYTVVVDSTGATLSAESIWGVLRGLETFSQLIYKEEDILVINATTITDSPRFPHRGLLIDTSRHFEPVTILLQMLDAMAYNKLNVFHWHIVDDHSFPYKSRIYPELSEQGAYHPVQTVYQQSDISRVIEYARLRGIRVIPEFDTPGHTRSWGVAHPELLTTCYSNDGPNGQLGPMNPTSNTTYDFISRLFTEVVQVFPDSYFHVGGDEVDFECWQSNPEVGTFMTDSSISSYEQLESYFIQQVVDILDSLESRNLVWEEVFVNGVQLPNATVVHVWKINGLNTLREVVESGHYGLYSTCWYLSDLHSGSDWNNFYNCEPLYFIDEEERRKLVLGGEACMWGEYVNQFSIIPRVWPRASAVAERLWSAEDVKDMNDAKMRLEEHACRMNKRGIGAQPPNGPGICLL